MYERLPSLSRWLRPVVAGWDDNLRLRQHLALSEDIEDINEVIETSGVLYWSSNYYGASTHGVVEQLGIRDDVLVRYVYTPVEIPADERRVYLTFYRGGYPPWLPEDRFFVRPLGRNLFHLTPQVELTVKDHFGVGEPIPLEATAPAFADTEVRRVEFLMDGQPIGDGGPSSPS